MLNRGCEWLAQVGCIIMTALIAAIGLALFLMLVAWGGDNLTHYIRSGGLGFPTEAFLRGLDASRRSPERRCGGKVVLGPATYLGQNSTVAAL